MPGMPQRNLPPPPPRRGDTVPRPMPSKPGMQNPYMQQNAQIDNLPEIQKLRQFGQSIGNRPPTPQEMQTMQGMQSALQANPQYQKSRQQGASPPPMLPQSQPPMTHGANGLMGKPMGGFGPSGPPTTGGFDYNLIKGTDSPSPPSQGRMQATQQANVQTQGSMPMRPFPPSQPGMPAGGTIKPMGAPPMGGGMGAPMGGRGGMGGMSGAPAAPMGGMRMKKGGKVQAYAKGGMVSSSSKSSKPSTASSRGDGIAQRGRTKGVMR